MLGQHLKVMELVTITGKVVSYCEIPKELTSNHWISDYYPDSYVQVHIEQEDEAEVDKVSEWILNKYPELKDENYFFIHVDY